MRYAGCRLRNAGLTTSEVVPSAWKGQAILKPDIEVCSIAVRGVLGVSDSKAAKRGPAPRLQQQLEQISQLPRTKQRFVMEMLDTMIHQAS